MNKEKLDAIKGRWAYWRNRSNTPITVEAAMTIVELVSEVERLRELIVDAANMLPTHQAKGVLNSMREGEDDEAETEGYE